MVLATADLWDANQKELTYLNLPLQNFGLKTSFAGEIVALKVFEDNTWVRKILSENGEGKVLVIDGGGSRRCALVGDKIAKLALDNNWAGLLVYGCIRDCAVIDSMLISLKAIGTCPVKSIKEDVGYRGLELLIAGCTISEGNYLYADQDGVLISTKQLA